MHIYMSYLDLELQDPCQIWACVNPKFGSHNIICDKSICMPNH